MRQGEPCLGDDALSDFHETAEPEAFDFITTFDAIHDQVWPLNVLKGIQRALKPDGVYLRQDIRGTSHAYTDIGHPIGTFLYTASTLHCLAVSLGDKEKVDISDARPRQTAEMKFKAVTVHDPRVRTTHRPCVDAQC